MRQYYMNKEEVLLDEDAVLRAEVIQKPQSCEYKRHFSGQVVFLVADGVWLSTQIILCFISKIENIALLK